MQNQQALHHSQNTQLFFPSIISMSLINRFPPAKVRGEKITAAACAAKKKKKKEVVFTVYVADADDLKERQKKQHPAGDKLVDESHPVYSCLQTHNRPAQRVKRLASEEDWAEDKYPGDTWEAQEIEDDAGRHGHQNPFVWQEFWEGISQAGGEHL